VRAELDGADDEFFLVDLPGYGFARAPKAVRDAWKPLIESYLGGSSELLGVVQLIDARHDPTAEDLRMIEYLASIEMPTLFVLTKIDKLKAWSGRSGCVALTGQLGVDAEQVIPFSSRAARAGRAAGHAALTC
jgi:GTP-binding protein